MDKILKDFIYQQLYEELSNVEIIHHGKSIWFIDRDNKYWYFELDTFSDTLWWRYDFFVSFFKVFSMDNEKFTPIIANWVANILSVDFEVSKTGSELIDEDGVINNILNNNGVTLIPANDGIFNNSRAEIVIKSEPASRDWKIGEVLKTISKTSPPWASLMVNQILKSSSSVTVNKVSSLGSFRQQYHVDEVLKTKSLSYYPNSVIDSVLNK